MKKTPEGISKLPKKDLTQQTVMPYQSGEKQIMRHGRQVSKKPSSKGIKGKSQLSPPVKEISIISCNLYTYLL